MSLTAEERPLLKHIYQQLDENKPLKPGDPLYQPVYDYPGCDDPVELMQKHIEWSGVESVQLFSGFRGSGKTTELFRLQKRLEDGGYVVLYADALEYLSPSELEYLSPSEEVDIANLLIVLAGAFSDALEDRFGTDIAGESYWTRFVHYLKNTEVEIPETNVPVVKLSLKTSPSFRQQLEQSLAHRVGELKNEIDKFIQDGVKKIRQHRDRGGDTQVVFLFDSLEQVRGSRSNEQAVIRSVERLFANYYPKMLTLPYVHAVYTVPPWLQFAAPNITKMIIIPCVRQWENDATRSKHRDGCQALCSLVRKRFGEEGSRRCFGEPGGKPFSFDFEDVPGEEAGETSCKEGCGDCSPLLQKILDVCGGHFRDLLLLLREALLRAKSLPFSPEVIEAAISEVRGHFLPIAMNDAQWLHQIADLRAPSLPSASPEDVNRLTRFLDTHFVLYFRNGNEWYDIHPLIRDEVAAMVERHAQGPTATGRQPLAQK